MIEAEKARRKRIKSKIHNTFETVNKFLKDDTHQNKCVLFRLCVCVYGSPKINNCS